jgi:hypothetical protein
LIENLENINEFAIIVALPLAMAIAIELARSIIILKFL